MSSPTPQRNQTLSDSYSFLGWAGEEPDSDTLTDRYMLYQIPGASLDRWETAGTPPPFAPHIAAVGDGTPAATIVADRYGNALGGVRTPYGDVPIGTYYGTTPGHGTCTLLWGHWTPFSESELRRLYPTHSDYVTKIKKDVAALLAQRFLTSEDAAAVIQQAENAGVP